VIKSEKESFTSSLKLLFSLRLSNREKIPLALARDTDMAFHISNSANRSNETIGFQFNSLWQLKLTAYFIVFGISLVGNTLVIAVHAIVKNNNNINNRMKAASNYFLVNMAVADLIVTVFNLPVELTTVVVGPTWLVSGLLGLALCKCYGFSWFQAVNVSTGSLSAIAIDRFLLVFYPYKRIITRRAAKIIIASIWLAASALTLPLFAFYHIKIQNEVEICYPKFDGSHSTQVYLIVNFVAFLATPLAIMNILYPALSVKLWLKKPVVNQMSQSHHRDEKINRKVTVMLIMIVFTFALCWLPYWIGTFYCYTIESDPVCLGYRLHFTTKFLGFSNSAFNPCIYFSFSDSFCQGAKELCKRFHCVLLCRGAEVSPANNDSLPVNGTATSPN